MSSKPSHLWKHGWVRSNRELKQTYSPTCVGTNQWLLKCAPQVMGSCTSFITMPLVTGGCSFTPRADLDLPSNRTYSLITDTPWENICSGCLGSCLYRNTAVPYFLSGSVSTPPFHCLASCAWTHWEISSIEAQSAFQDWLYPWFEYLHYFFHWGPK